MPQSANPAPITPKRRKKPVSDGPKGNVEDARYLLSKFIAGKPDFRKEFPLAYKILKKFPERAFWDSFPLKAQVPSLAIIWEVKSRAKLSRMHAEFLFQQKMNENVMMVSAEPHDILKEKVGDDKVFPCRRKQSIIEFCK